jgi:hypothetical protein
MAREVQAGPVGVASRWRLAVGTVAGLNAVGALGGAVGLVSGWLTLGDVTDRLPLGSTVLAGIALGLFVCLPQAVLTLLALRRSSATAATSVLAGSLLVFWILLEVAFLQVLAGLQVTYLVIGLVQIGLGLLLGLHDPGLTPLALAAMAWAVVADVPRFLVAPLHRPRHLRWGATADEVAAPMPGDEKMPDAQYVATRAIDIDAPPVEVWPWIVQLGADRAGWYSDDLLNHAGRPSTRLVHLDWQQTRPGDVVAMSGRTPPPPGTYFVVDSFEAPRWLLWSKADSTWSWRLEPRAEGGTRLVTRVRARYDWRRPAVRLIGVLLMELGDYPMMRRMLLGIRSRAAADRTGLTSW